MEREKLLQEHKATLESLVEKINFVYSEEFYKLDETEKQKFIKAKMATEAHVGSLSNILWSDDPKALSSQSSGLMDLFGLAIIGSMFNNPSYSIPPQTAPLEEKDFEEQKKEEVYAFPQN